MSTEHYDSQFQNIKNLTWLPWVGREFPSRPPHQKLLVVGESHYVRSDASESVETLLKQHLEYPQYTREIVEECLVNGAWRNRTLDTLPKLLFGDAPFDRTGLWANTSYYNFIQRPMHYNRSGSPERPSPEDFAAGWEVFVDVVNILQPSHCLFIGVEAANTFDSVMRSGGRQFEGVEWTQKVSTTYGRTAKLHLQSSSVELMFVQHLAKYFSRTRWNSYLKTHHSAFMNWMESEAFSSMRGPRETAPASTMSSPHFTSVMPTMPVQDLAVAVAFYTEQLDFEVDFQNGTTYAIVSRDGVELGIAAPPVSKAPAGHGGCYFKLSEGIDELYEGYRARGATILHELRDEPYGMREFMIADADKNEINFGQPLP